MIKVLYLRSSFNPGGTESLLLNLFNYDQDQMEFHYVLIKDGGLIEQLQSKRNHYYKVFRKRTVDFGVIKKIKNIINKKNIQIVHTHQMFELFYTFILKIQNPKLRLFHTIHGYHGVNQKWAQFLEKILIRFTEKLFTVSNATRNILEQKGYPVKKIQVLYNAVSLSNSIDNEKIESFKKQINYKHDDIIIGMIGNFVWQKDQMTMINAFKLLQSQIPNLKLVFIGKESSLSEDYKQSVTPKDINKRVFFLGALENASQYLKIFDIFIMSTLMDTFGIVVIEALLQKVPVVASDIEVMKELSHNGKYFELFETRNPKSLADKIQYLYNNKNKEKNEEAFQYAKENYSYKRYIELLEKHYLN